MRAKRLVDAIFEIREEPNIIDRDDVQKAADLLSLDHVIDMDPVENEGNYDGEKDFVVEVSDKETGETVEIFSFDDERTARRFIDQVVKLASS